MRTRLCTLVLVTLSLGLAAHAQDAPVAPDAAATASPRTVAFDLFPTFDGLFVGDLSPGEVELREDGTSQEIVAFERRRGLPASGPGDPPRLVVFVDAAHVPAARWPGLRSALVSRLDTLVAADARIALVSAETVRDGLTFLDRGAALEALRQLPVEQDDPAAASDLACVPGNTAAARDARAEMAARRRERDVFDALEALVARASRTVDGRLPVVLVSAGWRLYGANPNLARDAAREPGELERRMRGGGRGGPGRRGGPRADGGDQGRGRPPAAADASGCEDARRALAALDHASRVVDLSERANRALLAFYPVTPEALAGSQSGSAGADAGTDGFEAAREDSLRTLAEQTDGTGSFGGAAADRAWRSLAGDTGYYLVRYVPQRPTLDGRFRAVSVKVLRPGVRVRARRGYRGRSVDEMFGGSGAPARGRDSAAVRPVQPGLRVRPASWTDDDAPDASGRFWLVGELDYRLRRELVWTAGASAEITVLAGDGTPVVARTIEVPAGESGFLLRVPDAGGIPPGDYAVRVLVRPSGASYLSVADVTRVVVPSRTTRIGEAVLWRRGVATGPRFVLTADPRFVRSDRLRLELPVSSDGPATARMLDRARQPMAVPVTVSERTDAATGQRWVAVETALAALATGEYAIDVTVDGEHQTTVFQMVP